MAYRTGALVIALLATATLLASADAARTLKGVDIRSSSCPNLIQEGQTGACVSSTQELLNGKGASLTVDGDFGPLTTTATKNFQSSKGLSVSRREDSLLTADLACVSLPELAASTGDAAPSDPGLKWRSARAQADGIVGPNTKAALYATTAGPAPATGSLATVLSAARAEKGVPYVWGGGHKASPGKSTGTCVGYTGSIQPCPAETTVGYDCSGLTRWAYYKAFGADVNNGATGTQESKLTNAGKRTTSPVPGDLIFWDGHTAIYCGSNCMIEAKQTGTDVHEVALRSGGRYYHY